MQGVVGVLLIKLNTRIALFRERSCLKEWPILEVVVASGVTASISYLVRSYYSDSSPLIVASQVVFQRYVLAIICPT